MIVFFLSLAFATERWSGTVASVPGMRLIAKVDGFNIFEAASGWRRSMTASLNLTLDLPQKRYRRYYRNGVTDPLFPMQWHLRVVNYSETLTGRGVKIAIVDDGVQWRHPDLQSNYDAASSYDFDDRDNDPTPSGNDGHGTACAGVAAAVRNTVCGRGVASEASIVGIRLVSRSVYDYEEAQALSHKRDRIRIYSCSWGPEDSGEDMVEPGQVMRSILKRGFESERSIFVWAAGNGRHLSDSSNYDGYANSAYTFAIGAIDYSGAQAYYSESGANVMAVTPSSGTTGHGITTTDLMGYQGYSSGECTSGFGGTSSSAPLAAGIIATMLGGRPDLKTRDVQHLIARYATKINPSDGSWSTINRRGYTHSNAYGFGLLKVFPVPRDWVSVPEMRVVALATTLPSPLPMDATVSITAPRSLSFIERVLVTVSMTHARRGQVLTSIRSPFATSILSEHRGDIHSGSITWTYSTLRHWGEDLNEGDVWTVVVRDDTNDGYRGTVQRVSVEWLGCTL